MRIAVLTSSYPRFPGDGTAPFVQSLAETMAHQGHAVTVVAPYDPAVQLDHASFEKVNHFRYIWPSRWHKMGHGSALEGDTHLKWRAYFLLPFFFLGAFLKLMQVTRQQKSELVHAHWVLPNGPAAAITAKLRRIPLVISLHGSDIYIARMHHIFGLVARWVFRQASAVTTCSPALRTAAIELGAPQSTQLIAWGADPNTFHPKSRTPNSNHSTLTVASLGRMVPKKGFDHLLLAWQDIASDYPQAKLILGGEGPQRAVLMSQAARLGLANSVTFPGRIPWNNVPDFFSDSDIFVLPSQRDPHGNMDGLPTVLLEAMSCGVPVIATKIGGVPLVVSDFQNGIVISPEEITPLVNAIKFLLDRPDERQRLGEAARQSITMEFNWKNVTGKFIVLFQQAILKQGIRKLRLGSVYREEITRHYNLVSNQGPILDVGCHDGYLLNQMDAGLRVGVDLDPRPVYANVAYVCADGCALPFAPDAFTQIYALDVLEHVPNDTDFAHTLIMLLGQRGELFLTTPSENIRLTPRFLTGWIERRWGHSQRSGYSPTMLRSLFQHDHVNIIVQSWNAPLYRFLYLILRSLQTIKPKYSIHIVRKIAQFDSHHKEGHHGFYLIKIIPSKHSQHN